MSDREAIDGVPLGPRRADEEGPWFPPTDPVITPGPGGQPRVLGGFAGTSMDSLSVARSVEGEPGDEALAAAVHRALREDATTTDLEIAVRVRNGVVHLYGRVADLVDAENAEEVASRVPGVREVCELINVTGGQ